MRLRTYCCIISYLELTHRFEAPLSDLKTRYNSLELKVRCMNRNNQCSLLGMSLNELTTIVDAGGQPSYRARQLFDAVYRQRVEEIADISNLPLDFRQWLIQQGQRVGLPVIDKKFLSRDGTVRYLIKFDDDRTVETVWMPEGDGGEAGDGSEIGDEVEKPSGNHWERATICVSSQIGCAVECQFCMTALLGVERNLTSGEIVGQVCAVLNDQRVSVNQNRINLVFMGMGEPFLNFDNFMKAIRLLVEGVGISQSRMTVSTAGIVPRIYDLGQESVRPKLAISLNAPNDELRTRLMPINRKWDIKKLLAAAREFPLKARERLTFEYVLLNHVNDDVQNARQLVELLRGLRAKVNLIALNPGTGIDFETPDEDRVYAFQKVLMAAGVPTFIRRPRGRDIYAACGQLKRTVDLVQLTA
jgi:23S rRNA (adenine2503-C2)-methyltransferase